MINTLFNIVHDGYRVSPLDCGKDTGHEKTMEEVNMMKRRHSYK